MSPSYKNNPLSKVITLNLPDQILEAIEVLVRLGFYPNRSETIRQAIKMFLSKEKSFNEDLSVERFTALKEMQMNVMTRF